MPAGATPRSAAQRRPALDLWFDPWWFAVTAVYAALVAAKLALHAEAWSAFIFGDELFYRDAARAVVMRGEYLLFVEYLGRIVNPYPPLTSIVMAPAMVMGDWYAWALRINAITSSLVLVPVWLVARTMLSRGLALVAALLAAVFPIHAVYPRMLTSEGLYFSLFALAVALVVLSPRNGPRRALLLGVVLGLCQLTRHLSMVAAPVLVLCYLAFHVQRRPSEMVRQGGLIALGGAVVYLPWVVYSVAFGSGVAGALGVSMVAGQVEGRPSDPIMLLTALPPWMLAYALTLTLLVAPAAIALVSGRWWAGPGAAPLRRLGAVLLLTTGAFAATACLFLWRYFTGLDPALAYIEERYMLYAAPLLPALGLAAASRAGAGRAGGGLAGWGRAGVALASLGCVALATLAYLAMTTRLLWPSHPFERNVSTSPMLAALASSTTDLFSPTALALLGGMLLVTLAAAFAPRLTAPVLALALLVTYGLMGVTLTTRMNEIQQHAAHGRMLAQARAQASATEAPASAVWLTRSLGMHPDLLKNLLRFWDTPDWQDIAVETERPPTFADRGLYLTRASFPDPLLNYVMARETYAVYRLPLRSDAPLVIEGYGPQEIQAGASFSVQPDGASALWFRASGLTEGVALLFDGVEMAGYVDPTSGSGAVLIPPSAIARPGVYPIILRDALTGRESASVTFTVR